MFVDLSGFLYGFDQHFLTPHPNSSLLFKTVLIN